MTTKTISFTKNIIRLNTPGLEHPMFFYTGGKMFHYSILEANRPTTAAHISRMRSTIQEFGFTGVFVFIRSNKLVANDNRYHYYLLDGQHRLTAMAANEEPFPFYVVDETTIEKVVPRMAALNNVGKAWTIANFANAFLAIPSKIKAYTTLIFFAKEFGMSISSASQILMNGHHRSHKTNHVKYGSFAVNYLNEAEDMMKDYINILSQKSVEDRGAIFKNKHFMEGYVNFRHDIGDKYSHKKFVNALLSDVVPTVNARLLSEDWTQKFLKLIK
jgi:hypothetical protein